MTTLTEAAVRPLATLDPDAPPDDLTWLDDVVGDARVVALGESAHANAEFYELRHRVLRYLVERHGFGALVWESGFPEGWLTDAWIRGGDEPLGRVQVEGMTSMMGPWTQLAALLTWLRDHNTKVERQVGYYGLDLGGSNASVLPGLDAALAYLAEADPDYAVDPAIREIAASWAAPHVFAIPQAIGVFAELSQERRDALTAGLSRLVVRMAGQRLDYVARTGVDPYERASRSLQLAVAIDALAGDLSRGDQATVIGTRDAAMADTVEWILRREDRILVVAHNGHVQRFPILYGCMRPAAALGRQLADRLGSDYVAIGTTSGVGESLTNDPADFAAGKLFANLPEPGEGSLDALLHASHDGPFAVDLRRLTTADRDAIRAAGTQRFASEYPRLDALEAYDALVHLPHVTGTTFDSATLPFLPDDLRQMFTKD